MRKPDNLNEDSGGRQEDVVGLVRAWLELGTSAKCLEEELDKAGKQGLELTERTKMHSGEPVRLISDSQPAR